VAVCSIGIGILIGHFAIVKPATNVSWKYDKLTRQADRQNYRTFIESVQANNIKAYLK
jgi:hypothetical protein